MFGSCWRWCLMVFHQAWERSSTTEQQKVINIQERSPEDGQCFDRAKQAHQADVRLVGRSVQFMCELVLRVMMEERRRTKVPATDARLRTELRRWINLSRTWRSRSSGGASPALCCCSVSASELHTVTPSVMNSSRAHQGSIMVLQRPLLVAEVTCILLTLIYLSNLPFKFVNVLEMISLNSILQL